MDYLAQGCQLKYLLSWVSIEFSYQHPKDGSPSFASSVQKIPDWVTKSFVETGYVILMFGEPLVCDSKSKVVLVELSWQETFHNFRLFQFLPIYLENFDNIGQFLSESSGAKSSENSISTKVSAIKIYPSKNSFDHAKHINDQNCNNYPNYSLSKNTENQKVLEKRIKSLTKCVYPSSIVSYD